MATRIEGPASFSLVRDEEGHREYKLITWVTSLSTDGPMTVMNAPGLPRVGSMWMPGAVGSFSLCTERDPWAFCLPNMGVSIREEKLGDPNKYWTVEQTFSTKPLKRCQDETIEDPLLEPMKVSGGTVKERKEISKDHNPLFTAYGSWIKSSSHELMTGPNVEFDFGWDTVRIEQNVASLGLETITAIRNTLNDAPLWGMATRCVRLSDLSWERKYYGTCNVYYTRIFEFEVRADTFDREVADEGTKVLKGHWAADGSSWILESMIDGGVANYPIDPNPYNPAHFIEYKDQRQGGGGKVPLDGYGRPVTDLSLAAHRDVWGYLTSNFLLLGIPTEF
jgi:hypothetical protein